MVASHLTAHTHTPLSTELSDLVYPPSTVMGSLSCMHVSEGDLRGHCERAGPEPGSQSRPTSTESVTQRTHMPACTPSASEARTRHQSDAFGSHPSPRCACRPTAPRTALVLSRCRRGSRDGFGGAEQDGVLPRDEAHALLEVLELRLCLEEAAAEREAGGRDGDVSRRICGRRAVVRQRRRNAPVLVGGLSPHALVDRA